MAEEKKTIDPVDYAKKIQSAYADEDYLAVEKLEEMYGDQKLTLSEIERVMAYGVHLMAAYYMDLEKENSSQHQNVAELVSTLENQSTARFDTLVNILEEKQVITENEAEAVIYEDQSYGTLENEETEEDDTKETE